jgi:hypothetical protein
VRKVFAIDLIGQGEWDAARLHDGAMARIVADTGHQGEQGIVAADGELGKRTGMVLATLGHEL